MSSRTSRTFRRVFQYCSHLLQLVQGYVVIWLDYNACPVDVPGDLPSDSRFQLQSKQRHNKNSCIVSRCWSSCRRKCLLSCIKSIRQHYFILKARLLFRQKKKNFCHKKRVRTFQCTCKIHSLKEILCWSTPRWPVRSQLTISILLCFRECLFSSK